MRARLYFLSFSLLITFLIGIQEFAFSQCAVLPPVLSQGSNKFPNGLCSPVTADLQYQITFAANLPAGSTYRLTYEWGDGTPNTIVILPAGQASYNVTQNHPFPVASDCEYRVLMTISVNGAACINTRQQQIISTWRTDAFNGGNVQLISPVTNTDVHEVCEGVDIDVIFNDNTTFNCNAVYPANYPPAGPIQTPNEQIRWQQIIYNTPNGAARIPNVSVNGVLMPAAAGSNYVDTRTSGGTPAGSGVHVLPALVTIGDPDRRPSLRITAPGGFGAGFPVVGEEFEITIRYWNTCNPYDNPAIPGPPANIINGDFPPVERTARIRIIDAPNAPVVPDREICEGESRTLSVTAPLGAGFMYRWWNHPTNRLAANQLATGTTFTPSSGQAPAGVRTHFWVTVEATSAGNCRSASTEVTLTRRSTLPQPGTITGPVNLCPSTTGNVFSVPAFVPNDPPVVGFTDPTDAGPDPDFQLNTEYEWLVPAGWTITAGQGTRQITVTTGATVGAGTITTRLRYTTNTASTASRCPSADRTLAVNLRARPTATVAPNPVNICEGSALQLNATPVLPASGGGFNPTISAHTWSGNTAILDNTTVEDPNILTTTGDGTYNVGYIVTADFGNSVFCSSNIVNVPVNISDNPGAATVGANQQICFAAGPLTSGSLGGNTPAAGTGTWSQVSGPGTATFSGGVNNPSATATVTLNGIYVFRWRIVSGTCNSQADITVDYGTTPPTSNAGTNQDVCSATRTTTLNGNDPTFATGTWTQVSGPGTTTFVNANLRNTSITATAFGTYVYRWRITSGSCVPSDDEVEVIFRNPPVVDAQANFAACVDNPPTAAFNIPITGTFGGGASNARWEIVSGNGNGTFASSGGVIGTVDNTSPVADTYIPTADDFTDGAVTLRLVTDDPTGNCTAAGDNVIITIDRRPAAPNAGTNFSVCGASATMAATAVNTGVTPGAVGTWTGPGGVTFVNANSPTTVVNGLSNGPNVLRWTVTTATGICAAQFAEVTVTRNTLPANIDPLPERCVDIPGGTEAEFTLADLVALNDEITGIAGSTNRVVEFYTDAARTTPFTGPADFENGDKIYTIVRRTDVTPNCPRNGEITFVIHPRPGVSPQAPEFCEDFPVGSNTHTGIDLTSYNNAIKNNVGANTVAWFTNAARTIPVPTPTNVTANNGTKFYALVTNPTTTCSDTTSLEVIVNPRPVPNPLIGPTNVCVDASSAIVYQLQTNNVGLGYTFNWSIPTPPFVQMLGGSSTDYLVLMNFPTIVNPGQDIEVTEISDKGCSGDPNVINVSVETSPPPIVITSSSGTGPGGTGPFAVCANQSGVVFNVANLANTTYSWTVPAGSSVISGQGTNQITVNFGVVPGVIAVTPTTTTGCAGTPANGSVAINARPALDVLSNSVCSDTPGEITLSGTGAASFNITNVSISAGLSPASRPTGNGLAANAIFNDVFTNNTGGSLLVQYTVVPVSAQGCTGDPRIVNLTIEPEPVLNPNLSDAICSVTEDVNIVLTVAVGSTPASNYRIVSIINPDVTNVTQVAGVQAVPGDYNANILTDDRWRNVGVAPVTIIYMVHPVSASGCLGDPAIPVRVTVYPEPHVAAASETICSGDIPSITLTTSPLIAGSTFTWAVKSITGVITGATSGSGAAITNQLVNNDVAPGTVTYEVRATGDASVGGCQGPPTDVIITVNPAPLTTNVDKVECSTTAGTSEYVENLIALQPDINSDGSLAFSWHTSEADALGNVNAMSVATASAFPLQNGIPVFVRVSNGQCARVMAVTYTIHPTPSFSAAITSSYNGAQLSCNTSSNGIITVTAPTNGTAPYLYSIDGGTSYFTSLTFNGLSAAGNPYVVQTRDARGCIAQAAPLNFVPPPVLTATPAITSNFNGQHIRCHGENNGEVTVTATGGVGTVASDYRYSILELPSNTTGLTSGVFTGLTAGSYTFVVRDANLCSVTTTTVTLIDPPAINATAVLTSPVVCFGESNGVITVTATGGTLTGPTYTYTISPGGTSNTTGVFGGLGAGTYVVNVADNNTCVRSSNSVTVTQPSALTAFASVTSNYNGARISCPGADDGEITVTTNGGNGGYSYVLNQDLFNVSGNATGVYTDLAPGSYTVTVTDAQACSITTVAVLITEPQVITPSANITNPITCFGDTNGQITVTANGGTGTLTFTRITGAGAPESNTSGIFSGLGQGTYDFTVEDLNFCSVPIQRILTQPALVTATASVISDFNGEDISCPTSNDGIIQISAVGGSNTFNYTFNNPPSSNTSGNLTGIYSGVVAGTGYTFTVRDANAPTCLVVTAPIDVVPPTPLSITTATVTSNYFGQDISCTGAEDAEITVVAAGGVLPYRFVLNQAPLNVTGEISGVFTGVNVGNYTVTVRDANNCVIVTVPITVDPYPVINVPALVTSNYNGRQISCNGESDGVITVSTTGGVTPFTFVITSGPAAALTNTTGASNGIFTDLPAGAYTFTASDNNSCSRVTSTITISEPAVLAASSSVTSNYNGQQLSCVGASDGRIQVTATGGTTPYAYVISGPTVNATGLTSGIFTDLSAGAYTVDVIDVNGCPVTTASVTIVPPTALTISAVVPSPYNGFQISCAGQSDGRIVATATGGTGILTYVLNQPPTPIPVLPASNTTGIFTGLPARTSYTVTVTDVNGCNITTPPIDIAEPVVVDASGLITSNYNGQDISCVGATDGEITISANGGTEAGTYTYTLNQNPTNVSGISSGVFSGLSAGVAYTVTVRDLNNCFIVTAPITLDPYPVIDVPASVTSNYNGRQISCNGASDGVITVLPTGGVAPFTFVITSGPPTALSNATGAANGIFTDLPAGSYTITASDFNGCPRTTSTITISEPAVLTVTAAVTSNYNGNQIECAGDSNGIIRGTATGGTEAYAYELFNSIINLTTGNVSGTGSGIFTDVGAGSYFVRVTDPNGCSDDSDVVTLVEPIPLDVSAIISRDYNGQNISCNGANDAQVTVSLVSGGNGAISYSITTAPATDPSNSSGSFSGVFSSLHPGTYQFTATDVNGCSDTSGDVLIVEPDALTGITTATSDFNGFDISCFGEDDGELTVATTGGTGDPLFDFNYTVLEAAGNNTGQTDGVFNDLRAGSYRVLITDQNGCTRLTAATPVIQPADISIAISITSNYGVNGTDISCVGASDGVVSVNPAIAGGASSGGGAGLGIADYSYVLSPTAANTSGSANGIFTGLTNISYTVIATDGNGCTKESLPVVLIDPPPLIAGFIGSSHNICINQASETTQAFTVISPDFGGNGSFAYQWYQSTVANPVYPADYTQVGGATASTYHAPSSLATTTHYIRETYTTNAAALCPSVPSNPVTITVNARPTASIDPMSPVCQGQLAVALVDFTGALPYTFEFTSLDTDGNTTASPPGGTIAGTNSNHPLLFPDYQFETTLTITKLVDFNRCEAIETSPGVIAQYTIPIIKIVSDFDITSANPQCSGETFSFAYTPDPGVSYDFRWPDGTNTVLAPGTGTVDKILTSLNSGSNTDLPVILRAAHPSCPTLVTSKLVTIYPAIIQNIILGQDEVCGDDEILVTNNTLAEATATHTWRVTRTNDGAVMPAPLERNGYNFQEEFIIENTTGANPDNYELRYEVVNDVALGSCSSTTSVFVDVYRKAYAKIGSPKDPAATIPNFISPPGVTIGFDNATIPPPGSFADQPHTWVFSNNNVNTPPETVPHNAFPAPYTQEYLFANPGAGKRARLTVTNTSAPAALNGCTTTDEFVFPIDMTLPVAAFTVTPADCLPAEIEVDNQSEGFQISEWTVYDQNNQFFAASDQTIPTFNFTTEGRYRIELIVRAYPGGPPVPAQSQQVDIFANPIASFVTSPRDVVFVPDQQVNTINRSVSPYINPTYSWDFGDGATYTDFEPVHKYNVEGNYNISLTIFDTHIDGNGNVLVCKDSTSLPIIARAAGFVNVPNAFTPNRGGPTGGVVDNTGLTLNDVFLPATKGVREFQMQIFDRWGNMVFESKEQNRGWDGYDRNGNLLPSGVYVYKLVLRMANERRITQVGDVTLIR